MLGNLLRPAGHLWFIWSLFMWRIMIPFWMDLKNPVLASMGMALLTGFVQVWRQTHCRLYLHRLCLTPCVGPSRCLCPDCQHCSKEMSYKPTGGQ